jgi:hypothetical protein
MKRGLSFSSSFVKGFSRIFDLYGVMCPYVPPSSPRKDRDALRSDWQRVGRSIKKAMETYESSRKEAAS